jgi:hypothetical protein
MKSGAPRISYPVVMQDGAARAYGARNFSPARFANPTRHSWDTT